MRKLYLTLLLTWTFRLLAVAAGAGDSLQVELATGNLNLDPGRVHNLIFKITNNSTQTETVRTTAVFPDGWKLAVPMAQVTLSPGEQKIQLVSFNIPYRFQAGKSTVEVQFFRGKAEAAPFEQQIVEVTVSEVENFTFELLQAPAFVRGGEVVTATYLLKNTGNSTRRFYLESTDCDVTSDSWVVLKSGESTTVRAEAKTDKMITAARTLGITVQAALSEKIQKRVFHNVKVFPLREAEADLYFRYPVTLSSRYLARGRDGKYSAGYQLEAVGSGAIDQKGNHQLAFMARGPNNYDLSFLGLYDQYYLAYSNKNLETFIGHKSFEFTPLIESTRFGTGVENTLILNNGSRFGFLYVEPRFFRDIKNEIAAYADLPVFRKNRIGAYFLTKKMNPTLEDASLASLSSTLKPFGKTSLELEFSRGVFQEKSDNAFRAYLNSQFWIFSISGNYFYTGKYYPGYYSNSTFYSGYLNASLTKRISLGVSARQDFTNAALDTLLSSAPYSRMVQGSLNYRASRNLDVRSYYIRYERKDRMPPKLFDYHTESFNLFLNHNFHKLGYQVGGELGKTRNNLVAAGVSDLQNSFRTNLNIYYRPSYLFNIQAFTSFTNMNSFIASNQKNWLWGVSAFGQVAKNLRTNFQVQNSYSIEDYYQNRNLFQLNLDYSFLKRHKISLNSFYTLFQNQTEKPDYSFSVTYSVEIGIPLKKTGEAGSVAGQLSGTDGQPLNGIIVFLNGRSAVTDENGLFRFRNVVPGRYHLMVDRSKFSIGEIINIPAPVTLEVTGNQETRINLALVQAARLQGKFVVRESALPLSMMNQEPPRLGNIVMDLKDELETIRIITNPDGTFLFPTLRPGEWVLHIFKNNIDSQYNLAKEFFELKLLPGQTGEVVVELLPKTRKIIFNANTINVSSTSSGETAPKETAQPAESRGNQVLQAKKEIWFSVQVAAAISPIAPGSHELKGETGVFEKKIDGRYKYFSGRFTTIKQARLERNRIREKIPGAFVVAFEGEQPVPLGEALKRIKP